uniref:Protein translocase subunit SecE n=1 Tax=Gloeochaete wittrockiana TaxID=38269 RepID=A0A3G1IVV0_9EUKA|nr:hypothetical protein [Gloeochaete wittrockiana]YP_009546109.1 hypothetical protein [Gloeochaete wittrockiana]ASQ40127.1 hypothetical protein [Gloeochaete wittrockiana]ASQ40170.1 hypothetical protein [Gloeochaete wittrockiana]
MEKLSKLFEEIKHDFELIEWPSIRETAKDAMIIVLFFFFLFFIASGIDALVYYLTLIFYSTKNKI